MDEHRLMDDEEGGEHNDPYSVDGHDGLGANSPLGSVDRSSSTSNADDEEESYWVTGKYCLLAIGFYFGVYTVRYPMFLLQFPGMTGGIENKAMISIAQTVAYGAMKLPAIKYMSELERRHRFKVLLTLYMTFAACVTLPLPFTGPVGTSFFVMLGSGCASCIWGVTLQYLEGRRHTDLLFAAMNSVVIFGPSVVRSVGEVLRRSMAPEREAWMPFITAALYMPVALYCLWKLDGIKAPSQRDIVAKSIRRPMTSEERWAFIRKFSPALIPIIPAYMVMTAYRAFRDYYAPEIYGGVLGRAPTPGDYLLADWPGGIIATLALALLVKVEDNRRAVLLMHLGMMGGAGLLFVTTLGYTSAGINPMLWITVSTCGLMLMYTPTGSFLYDRLMAATGTPGTTSFLVFLSDGLGYLAVVAILLAKTFAASDVDNTTNNVADDAGAAAGSAGGAGGAGGAANYDGTGDASDTEASSYGSNRTAAMFVTLTYGLAVVVFLLLLPATAWLRRHLPKSSRAARLRQQRGGDGGGGGGDDADSSDNGGGGGSDGGGGIDFMELDDLRKREPIVE